MSEIFKSVLLTSAVGGAFSLVLLCIKPVTGRYFSPKWQYYIWLAVLIIFVLPVRFSIPSNRADIPPVNEAVQTEENAPINKLGENAEISEHKGISEKPAARTPAIPVSVVHILSYVWICAAILLFGYKMIRYAIFLQTIRKNSYEEYAIEDIPERLRVRRTDLLDAPLITGLIKPELYLPQRKIGQEELEYILLHELTHYRRRDILYKWFAVFVSSVHWFNPLVYTALAQIDEECEISCDWQVCRTFTQTQKNSYMTMILNLAAASASQNRPLAVRMASSKKILKRRFEMIRNKKAAGKAMSVLSVFIAVTMISATVFASGLLADLASDDYTIEVTDNGGRIDFANKPFVENNTVYLPLREILHYGGIEDKNITWNNGYVEFLVFSDKPIEYRGDYYNYWINRILIGSSYAYMGGHSHGTTENSSLLAEPVLKNNIAYVPYDFIKKLSLSGQDLYENISVSVTGRVAEELLGYYYLNDDINLSLALPLFWENKYQIVERENEVEFWHNTKQYGPCAMFFYISAEDGVLSYEEAEARGMSSLIMVNGNRSYILTTPMDAPYPIVQMQMTKEDYAIMEEYEKMAESLNTIRNSVQAIVRFQPLGE